MSGLSKSDRLKRERVEDLTLKLEELSMSQVTTFPIPTHDSDDSGETLVDQQRNISCAAERSRCGEGRGGALSFVPWSLTHFF